MHVALHATQLRPLLLRPTHAVGFIGKIEQQASDRDQAFAHLGRQIALAADGLEYLVVASGAVVFRLKNVMRDLIDLGPDPFKNVGRTIDHRVEQIHQHRFSGDGR